MVDQISETQEKGRFIKTHDESGSKSKSDEAVEEEASEDEE